MLLLRKIFVNHRLKGSLLGLPNNFDFFFLKNAIASSLVSAPDPVHLQNTCILLSYIVMAASTSRISLSYLYVCGNTQHPPIKNKNKRSIYICMSFIILSTFNWWALLILAVFSTSLSAVIAATLLISLIYCFSLKNVLLWKCHLGILFHVFVTD